MRVRCGRKLELGPRDVFLQKAPVSFDASVQELFNSFACGGVLLLAEFGGERDTQYLARLCKEQRVTCASFVPSQLDALLQATGPAPCVEDLTSRRLLTRVLCAGAGDARLQVNAPCAGGWRGAAACVGSVLSAAPAAHAPAQRIRADRDDRGCHR
jgi:non-ribosomal peptide synthetase component F